MKIHGTAKGAALSTKDFGVAFGAPTPEVQTCQGESYSSENKGLGQDDMIRIGMMPATNNPLIDIVANKFSLNLKRQGSLTSYSIGARIYDDSDPPEEQAQSNNTISDVADDWEFRQFTFDDDFTVTANFYYVIYIVSGTFTSSNRVDVRMSGYNVPATSYNATVFYTDAGGWNETSLGNYWSCAICFTG